VKNKKKVVSVLFFLSAFFMLFSAVYAQEIKFMLGGNLSKYSTWPEVYFDSALGDEYTYEIGNKKGFLLGSGIEFALTRNVAIEIDGLYFQKGSRIQKCYSLLEIYVCPKNYTLHVINIPLLLKIKFLSGSSPYVLGGGEFSFILSHGCRSILDGRTGNRISIKEFTKSFDYGLVLGGGFEVNMEATSYFIEGRYYLGLRNIIKGSIDWETTKTSAVALILGLKIKFRK